MDLKEFVAESLKQIIDGVIDAQTYVGSKGASINPNHQTVISPTNYHIVDFGRLGPQKPVQILEFDVVVTVTETEGVKASIGVFSGILGAGIQSKLDGGNTTANRIKFSVPVLLPEQPIEAK